MSIGFRNRNFSSDIPWSESLKSTSSISALCRSVSLRVTLFAAISGLVFFGLLFAYATTAEIQHESDRLSDIAPLVARSISGEAFVDDGRSLRAILPEVARKFSIRRIEILGTSQAGCEDFTWTAAVRGSVCRSFALNVGGRSVPVNLWTDLSITFRLSLLLFGLLNLVVVLGFGAVFAKRMQKRLASTVVAPMEQLASDPEAAALVCSDLVEVQKIRRLLQSYIEQKDRQRELEERVRLDQIMGDLALRVAHDIRSPLFALKVLTEDLQGATDLQRRRLLSAINRINEIALDLLTTGKSNGPGKGEVSRPAAVLIEEILAEKRLQYKNRKDLSFDFECDNVAGEYVAPLTESETKRLFSNLINNSVEAMESGGRVLIRQSLNDGVLHWEIHDSGKGIPPEVLPRLLKGGVSYDKAGGYGLGLSGAKRVIERYEGSFEVDSVPGQGTVIRIVLLDGRGSQGPTPRGGDAVFLN